MWLPQGSNSGALRKQSRHRQAYIVHMSALHHSQCESIGGQRQVRY